MFNQIKFIVNFIDIYKKHTLVVIFVSILAAFLEASGFALVIPLLNSIFIDSSSGSFFSASLILADYSEDQKLIFICILIVLVFLFRTICSILNIFLISKLSWNLRTLYATKIMDRYTNSHYESTINKKIGAIVNDTLTETTRGGTAVRYFVSFITRVFLGLGLTILLMFTNYKITLVIFGVAILFFFSQRRFSARFANWVGRERLNLGKSHTEQCTEMITSIREAKILGLQKTLISDFKTVVHKYSKINILYNFISDIPTPIIEFIIIFIFSCVVYFSYVLSFDIKDNFAVLGVFFIITIRLFQVLAGMISLRMKYLSNIPSIETVLSLSGEEFKKERQDGEIIKKIQSPVILKDISFNYANNENIFNNLNISFPQGFNGIVGESGSGKSTLVNMLTCLLIPNKGDIIFGSNKISEVNIKSFRDRISYVSQSPYLFNDTIINNIKKANKNATNEDVYEATKKANASKFIMELKNGYNTTVGDRGVNLSGGQIQRIAIARSILRNPDLYIFDECTSGLDSKNEKLIMETVLNLSKNKIVIFITHNKTLLKDADFIYLVSNNEAKLINYESIS